MRSRSRNLLLLLGVIVCGLLYYHQHYPHELARLPQYRQASASVSLRSVISTTKKTSIFDNNPDKPLPRCTKITTDQPSFPMWSCAELRAPDEQTTLEERAFFAGMEPICRNSKWQDLVKATVSCAFEENFLNVYDRGRWANDAFVTYIYGSRTVANRYINITEALVESVHALSLHPIIVVCVDSLCDDLSPTKFPRLVVINVKSKPMPPLQVIDYFKWLSLLLARVRTGIFLDNDMMVLPQIDVMFPRVRLHSSAAYPYPIFPVHWMSRDPAGGDYTMYAFKPPAHLAANRTMRWSHAFPFWSYHAQPFIGEVATRMLRASLPVEWSDEEVVNYVSWEHGLSKQWCRWDNEITVFDSFHKQSPLSFGTREFADKRWYPEGVPFVFAALHSADNPAVTRQRISQAKTLAHEKSLQIYFWKGKWYPTAGDLLADNPPCVV